MPVNSDEAPWPELPYAAWKETCATLQLWTQIVGKIRLALTPWLNHSWHVALYVTARGLSTSLISFAGRGLEIEFDFIGHVLWLRTSDGNFRQVMLRPIPVAEFYVAVLGALSELNIDLAIHKMPNEIPDAIPFEEDFAHGSYDKDFVNRFWRILLRTHDVFFHFRTAFLGKTSPVHFFWGSFDLAVTRFSGRRAPLHRGACRTCLTQSCAKRIPMKCRALDFGLAGGQSIIPHSIPMRIRRRTASRPRPYARRRRSSATNSASLFSLMTPFVWRPIQKRPCWNS